MTIGLEYAHELLVEVGDRQRVLPLAVRHRAASGATRAHVLRSGVHVRLEHDHGLHHRPHGRRTVRHGLAHHLRVLSRDLLLNSGARLVPPLDIRIRHVLQNHPCVGIISVEPRTVLARPSARPPLAWPPGWLLAVGPTCLPQRQSLIITHHHTDRQLEVE